MIKKKLLNGATMLKCYNGIILSILYMQKSIYRLLELGHQIAKQPKIKIKWIV